MIGNDPQVEQKVLDVLGAGVDVRRLPDGVYVVDLKDGGVIQFGEDDEGDWWTATRYENDSDHMIYEGQDLAELGRIITASAVIATHIATSVWNDNTHAWERIDIEPIRNEIERDLGQVEVSAHDTGLKPGQSLLVELLDANGATIESTEITVTGEPEGVTYAAHIVTGEAQDLGEPGIIVMTHEDARGAGDFLVSYPLAGLQPDGVLWKNGWSVEIGSATQVQPGYTIATVKPHDWNQIVKHAKLERDAAKIEAERKDKAWATLIRDAMHDGASATKLADAAGTSRARVYQIRDGRR